jgi:hypothetical protein
MRVLLVLVVLLIAGVLVVRHLERTRPQDLPWTPLDLTAPVGAMTGMKLQMLRTDPAMCRDALARAGVGFMPVPDRRVSADCGLTDAVTLDRTRIRYAPTPVTTTCPLAAALVLWERQVAAPAARRHFGRELVGVEHFGIYSCRRLYGSDTGPFSEHATANAIDLAAFYLDDRTQISVRRDWDDSGAKAAFLRDVHEGACDLFGTTLGPDYNAAHRDHFHLDMRGWKSCR